MSKPCPIKDEVKKFQRDGLAKVEPQEKNTLPTQDVINDEKQAIAEKCLKEPLNEQLESFNQKKLKKTTTAEKNPLPTTKVIDDEKEAIKEKVLKEPLNSELEHFNPNNLKKADTKVPPLPTAEEIEAEKKSMSKGK